MSRYVTLVWKKNKIVNVSFYAESCQITVFTNSAGFLTRCKYLLNFVVHIFSQAVSSMLCIFFLSLLFYTYYLLLPSTP